ncbi:1-deoxy-D-xylulose-5-phosphate synthase 1 [Planctomycetales bacterium]|nr:1-deoxy-D-xylulose-5-phosphate synthase 1 [Planctomycetales bacterium]
MAILYSHTFPADLTRLTPSALAALAAELRALMIEVVGKNGGHLASSLGVVELTLALHRVFDFRRDALMFDVGHQCYAHKILTGRRDRFSTLRQMGGLSGFPNAAESPYDYFTSGHASASVAAAAGWAAAAKIRGEARQAVAVIGDGSLGGGLAFEAMNHAGQAGLDLLVVLNDNEMSIGKTVGAFAAYLEQIRARPDATRLRQLLRRFLRGVPLVGNALVRAQEHLLNLVKNPAGAFFQAMNFRYFGPFDGHDIPQLLATLTKLKNLSGPRLLHVITEKGRGFSAAAADPESFHSAAPFATALPAAKITLAPTSTTYTDIFGATLCAMAAKNPRLVAITAAMTAGAGLKNFAAKFPDRFYDVGIAESYAVTLAAGLARGGMLPVVGIYSTFLQRAYDQIFHDVLLQKNLPLILAIDRAGLVGNDGPTHHGAFDLSYLRHFPDIVLLAPRDGDELATMLQWAANSGKTCAIRYPRGAAERGILPFATAPLTLGRGEKLRDDNGRGDGALVAYGRLVAPAFAAAEKLAERGKNFAVYNARFAKPLDEEMLRAAAATGRILTLEDNAAAGGFGSAVAEFLATRNLACRLQILGIPDRFIEGATVAQLDRQLGFDVAGIMRSAQEP